MLRAKNSGIVRGQTLRVAKRKCKAIFGRDQRIFAVVSSQIDLGSVDTDKLPYLCDAHLVTAKFALKRIVEISKHSLS